MSRRSQRGFTLVEVVVGTGILSLVTTLMSTGMFQAVTMTTKIGGAYQARFATGTAASWTARDVPMAQSTDLEDGAPPVAGATFTWTDQFGGVQTSHSLTYSLSGGDLLRTYDGSTSVIGRQVSSVGFSRSGRLITVTMTAAPENRFNVSDQKTLKVWLRSDG